jgi:transcriptional regulator with XRE-family HTH domain
MMVDGNEMSMDTDAERRKLGERLREAREYLGLSQEMAADNLDLPRPSISAMEAGKRKVSSLELKQLARLYKRPLTYFLGEESEESNVDETTKALYRAARSLSDRDRQQVLRFAEFLRAAGPAPATTREPTSSSSNEQ